MLVPHYEIRLSAAEQQALEALQRAGKTPQQTVRRVSILLLARHSCGPYGSTLFHREGPRATWHNGCQEKPRDAPEKVQYEDVAYPSVYFLEGHFAGIGDIESARVENHEAHKREGDDTERIDPVKPSGARVPYSIGFQFGHGGSL